MKYLCFSYIDGIEFKISESLFFTLSKNSLKSIVSFFPCFNELDVYVIEEDKRRSPDKNEIKKITNKLNSVSDFVSSESFVALHLDIVNTFKNSGKNIFN